MLAPLLLAFASVASAQPPSAPAQDDVKAIIRRSVDRDWSNFSRARDYAYTQRIETSKLDSKGAVTGNESKTFDVVVLGERPFRKLVAENDRPLDPSKAARAQKDYDEAVRKRRDLSETELRKQAEQRRKDEEESRAFVREIPEAFNFELVRHDTLAGMPVWVIRAEPRPGYKPKVKNGGFLTKFRGTLWIDEKEHQWVKVEAEVIDTVSFGWVLARLGKGTWLTFEQTRINDEVWLPAAARTKLNARFALFKSYRAEISVQWRDYKKFRTESRLLPADQSQ